MSNRDIVYDINRLASVISDNTEVNKRLAEAIEKLVEKMCEEEAEVTTVPHVTGIALDGYGGMIFKPDIES